MDEEALLYEDDYEPELYPEAADDGQQEATPTAAGADVAEEPAAKETAGNSIKDEGAASRGEEPAGPSGRGAAGNGPSKNRRGRGAISEGRGQGQGVRYFIIRSSTMQNVFISVRVGAWATTRQNDDKLDEAFRKSREVRLLYSVTGSNAFQGYAVMRTPVGKFGRPVVWENGKQFGNPFAVEWRVLFELSHSETDHIRNPYNDNKPVRIARDGTELPQEQGDLIVRLMQERAAAAGVKPPRQQLALMDAGTRPAPGQLLPGRGAGMPVGAPGRLAPGGRGPGMGPGMRPVGGPGMGTAAIMGMGGMAQGLVGPMAGMGQGPNLEQIAAAMAMGNMTPAALNNMLQQAGMGIQPGVGAVQQPDLPALAAAMVAQMASLLPEQQAMAMSVITASNPMLAEAMAAVVSGGSAGGVGRPALNAPAVSRGGPVMGMGNAMGGTNAALAGNGIQGPGRVMQGVGGGMQGPSGGMQGSGSGMHGPSGGMQGAGGGMHGPGSGVHGPGGGMQGAGGGMHGPGGGMHGGMHGSGSGMHGPGGGVQGAGGGMHGPGGGMHGPSGGMHGQGGLGPLAHRVGGAMIRRGHDDLGHGAIGPGEPRMFTGQQQQMQQAQQQFMNFNRDDVVLEGSDGRLRSGRSRSRSRSRSPVHVRRGGGGPVDFNSMTYEQYLQQYGRVQEEVSRRVGNSNGHHRGRSAERSPPQHAREPTPASQGGMGYARVGSGGGDGAGAMAGGGGAGSGMAAKPAGQPYTEEEYIRVTQMMYASKGQPAPSEMYIRQHYRQMLAQLQQR